MPSPDRFIAACKSWNEFFQQVKALPNRGFVFERLTQLYLQTAPEYKTELQHVWLLREVPADIRKRLNLPAPDEGIDLIACTRRGEYWAIQSKFLSQSDKALTRQKLGTFTSLAFNTCNDISLAVVVHTSTKPVSKRRLLRKTVEIGLDRWQALDQEKCSAWKLVQAKLAGRSARPKARQPKPHQFSAISAAKAHFISARKTRGRLIMPCGTGKSLTAFWIADSLKAKTILVAVPSLALIKQSVKDWTREYLAHNLVPEWICTCSDESVGELDRDEFVGEVYDTGLPTHTDPKEIATLLGTPSKGPKVVFTTYQSSYRLAAATRKARITFDLAILDEAHKTVGIHSKPFAALLSDKKVKIRRRIFMTATERVFRGDREDVLSMDNEKDYGERFFHLSFKEAIRRRLICDYKVLTITVNDARVRELVGKNRILNLNSRNLSEAEAQPLACGIALKRVFKEHGIKHAISFHRSIRAADRFRDQQDDLNRLRDTGPKTSNFHISSKKTAGQRADLLEQFSHKKRALMTNARCLTEGVDIPAIDCVVFADPKQSRIDIVQAAGRALRKYDGKEFGYIMLPLLVPSTMTFEDFAKTTAFRQIASTITALSTQDERIADEFRAIEEGRIPTGKIVEIEGDVPVGMKINLHEFAEAISTRLWDSVGRANWRPFISAREFVRSLGRKSRAEWTAYCQSDRRRPDIPTNPNEVYAQEGWKGMGDWLGTGTIATHLREYLPFKQARMVARSLNLKSQAEWDKLARSDNLPPKLPRAPHMVYADAGWLSWGDWLGTGIIATYKIKYRSFKEARTFARSLKLKNRDGWLAAVRSGRVPKDIPSKPWRTYANKGWISTGDWLGTGTVAAHLREYRPFPEARAFARELGLNSAKGWRLHCKLGRCPSDIPTNPNRQYRNEGWISWADWLGTTTIATNQRQYRPFHEARAFVHSLGWRTANQWRAYAKSGEKPDDIPAAPQRTYEKKGWLSWGDWLGSVVGLAASTQGQIRQPAREHSAGPRLRRTHARAGRPTGPPATSARL
jgi:superfamily II DNA or RNA helicase